MAGRDRKARRIFMYAVTSGIWPLAAGTAQAGFIVQQKVVYTGDYSQAAELEWHLGEGPFRLDVKRGADMRFFVFNGRVFYVCAKLDQTQLDYAKKIGVDKGILGSLEKGACQELTPDFGVKFFMSPYDAVGAVEAGAGFSTNLAVEDAEAELAGTVGAVGKMKCVNFTRSYTIADKKRPGVTQALAETQCNAPSVKWRQSFGHQLGMTLMRQPNGKKNYATLATDLKKLAGMTLLTTATVGGKSVTGNVVKRAHAVTTSTIKEEDVPVSDLAIPAGYEILSEESLAVAASVAAKIKVKSPEALGASQSGPSLENMLKFLILGVNPAAGLLSGE